MPIRIASVAKRISRNGEALHRARMARGADEPPSEDEAALLEERRLLKEERDKRKAQALQPKPTAVERMVRTHHAQPKAKPKAGKASECGKDDVKKPKPRRTRAEKHAEKAAALEAARRPKKAATK